MAQATAPLFDSTWLPLPRLTIAHPRADLLRELTSIIAEFINVKAIDLVESIDVYGTHTIKVNPKIGAAIGAKMKDVMAAQRTNSWAPLGDGRVAIAGLMLEPKDFELRVAVKNGLFAECFDKWRGLAVLDATITRSFAGRGGLGILFASCSRRGKTRASRSPTV